jgi:hypothetical protein
MQTIRTEKFGNLNFPNKSIVYTWNNSGQTIGLQLKVNGKQYTFVPENIVEKGFIKDGKQYYLGNVLVGDNIKRLGTDGQYIDLTGVSDFDNYLVKKGLSNTGFLLPASVANEMKILSSVRNYDASGDEIGSGMSAGPIQGISEINGKYVYVTTPMGKAQSTWIQPPGTSGYDGQGGTGTHQGRYTYTKSKFGFIGKFVNKLGEAVGSVPFLPEIIGIATGNPMLAAGLRGAASGAAGVDPLKAGLQAAATAVFLTPGSSTAIGQGLGLSGQAATIAGGAALGAGVSSLAGGDPLKGAISGAIGAVGSTTYATSVGEALGATGAAAPIVGNAVINAGLSGIAAVATGADIEKSMLDGAIKGAAIAGSTEFAEAILGKDNIASLAKATGLSKKQVASIFTTSVANGVTAEISGQGEFLETVGISLAAQGVGAKSANLMQSAIKDVLDKDPEIMASVLTATSGIATTATNAALRGEDVGKALENNAPGVILSSVQSYQSEADRQDALAAQKEKELVAVQQPLQVAGPIQISGVLPKIYQTSNFSVNSAGIIFDNQGYVIGELNENELRDLRQKLGLTVEETGPMVEGRTDFGAAIGGVGEGVNPQAFDNTIAQLTGVDATVPSSLILGPSGVPTGTEGGIGIEPVVIEPRIAESFRPVAIERLVENELQRLEDELSNINKQQQDFEDAKKQFERISELPKGTIDRELQGQLEQELADLEERATAAEARAAEVERERGLIEGIAQREGEGLSDQDLLTFLETGEVPGTLRGQRPEGEESAPDGAPEGTPEGEGIEPGAAGEGEEGAGEGGAGEGGEEEGVGGTGQLRTPLSPSLIFDRETGGRPETTPFSSRVTGEALASILGEKEPLFGGDDDEQRAVWNRRSLKLLSRALGL